MLPSHLQLSSSKQPHQNQHHPHEFIPKHPLGLTGVICQSFTLQLSRTPRQLQYTLYRPRHLLLGPPPLIGIAGGPGLPCQYLSSLVHTIEDRAIVLYDHVGCGQSLYKGTNAYDRYEMMLDLKELIDHLNCEEYHLLGHSFGGFLAYEYLLQQSTISPHKKCHSVVLVSTPYDMAALREHVQQLKDKLDDDQPQTFFQQHECRVVPLPLPLQQSLDSAGFSTSITAKVLAKAHGVSDGDGDNADLPVPPRLPVSTPALLLQGQHDFVNNVADWQDVFPDAEMVVLAGCAHYAFLENEGMFAAVVSSFLKRHEPPPKPLVLPKPLD
ncbi:hypothetical protein FisN_19Lh316 [Fistulifera solaris]|uniref:AB hydrolase-1 domain-containing protein n=1 Tax=Fistulifera solaris TaxID=1519565 RepID=A0A1Z5K7Q0_FISSO|nr:hypothetical protein FisN_19Lh316 [Fistulifera solaris]|eukprot:GAX22246.1 hypothetical protein FisN_19Lh316 [Fistulifera solaris]